MRSSMSMRKMSAVSEKFAIGLNTTPTDLLSEVLLLQRRDAEGAGDGAVVAGGQHLGQDAAALRLVDTWL